MQRKSQIMCNIASIFSFIRSSAEVEFQAIGDRLSKLPLDKILFSELFFLSDFLVNLK